MLEFIARSREKIIDLPFSGTTVSHQAGRVFNRCFNRSYPLFFFGHLWGAPFHLISHRSMYGIYTYIYHKNQPNVGKYTIHGSYGFITTVDPGPILLGPELFETEFFWPADCGSAGGFDREV